MKKFFCILPAIAAVILLFPLTARAQPEISAPGALLMEVSTGEVLYEKNAEEQRSPASITKIMTLLLIFDELEKGNISLEDQVTVSARAQSMGGSQVYLEAGETQTVETLIKCIVVASGNDASVAMAEYIAGSEEEFVNRMNERAEGLGMAGTWFEDCCGLTGSAGHCTTAGDVAVMTRELIRRYPQVLEYSSIWMEDITHVTARGSTPFTLTNTNKMIRSYEGCLGLKTGSTDAAGYCVSAVAEREGLSLIAVILDRRITGRVFRRLPLCWITAFPAAVFIQMKTGRSCPRSRWREPWSGRFRWLLRRNSAFWTPGEGICPGSARRWNCRRK